VYASLGTFHFGVSFSIYSGVSATDYDVRDMVSSCYFGSTEIPTDCDAVSVPSRVSVTADAVVFFVPLGYHFRNGLRAQNLPASIGASLISSLITD
jgi:hypothetical protein